MPSWWPQRRATELNPTGAARRGWLMVGAGASANFIGFGVLFSFGLFLTPLAAAFSSTTGRVAPVFSGSVGCYYLAGAIGGWFGDRFGARPVVAFAAVSLPAGLLGAAGAEELWQVYAAYVPAVGLAVGGCYAPLIGAVGRWFERGRARAIAVVLTGVGAGSLIMPLVIRGLLDRFGWRTTFRLLAVAAALTLGLTAVATVGRAVEASANVVRPLEMFASRRFRRLYLSVVLVSPGFYAPLLFLNDFARSRGSGATTAALLVSTIGLGSVLSRVPLGATAERFGPLRQYLCSHVLFVVGLVLWLAAGSTPAALASAAVLHGLGWAAWVTAAPLVLARWFGVESLGLLVGTFYTGLGVGALVGPTVCGLVIDAWGYRPAIALVALTTAASLTVVTRVEPRRTVSPEA